MSLKAFSFTWKKILYIRTGGWKLDQTLTGVSDVSEMSGPEGKLKELQVCVEDGQQIHNMYVKYVSIHQLRPDFWFTENYTIFMK